MKVTKLQFMIQVFFQLLLWGRIIAAIAHQCQELAALVNRHTNGKGDGFHKTAIEQLEFQRESSASTALQGVCEPIFAILVQGKKEALLGEETYRYGV